MQKTFEVEGEGTHYLTWTYSKDSSVSNGSDCGWVDDIEWTLDEDEEEYTPETDFMVSVDDNAVTIIGYTGTSAVVRISPTIDGLPVAAIGDWAFEGCGDVIEIVVPDSVEYIGVGAFAYCENLMSVKLPEGMTVIEPETFVGCMSLRTITIPSNVEAIGMYAFLDCYSLSTIFFNGLPPYFEDFENEENTFPTPITFVAPENMDWEYWWHPSGIMLIIGEVASPDDFEYTIEDGQVTITRFIGEQTSVIIPSAIDGLPVTTIGDAAFAELDDLTSIYIPDGVSTIGACAFDFCENLIDIHIPDSVTTIEYGAFNCCYSLATINIPDSVTTIGCDAFFGCFSLTTVNVPEGLEVIEDETFGDCINLTSITIPASVEAIGFYAFGGCSNLTTIYFNGEPPEFEDFYDLEAMKEYNSFPTPITFVVPEGMGWENWYDFAPQGITLVVGEIASPDDFEYTIEDEQVMITQYIGEKTTVIIPTAINGLPVTAIGNTAFAGRDDLTLIHIPNGVSAIGECAFLE